ncbi:MAG: helical backbone metal receptor [Burkholderiaceae bacterium]|nr:helical backbone metal receptor [Burkholderiaceae bacterium]
MTWRRNGIARTALVRSGGALLGLWLCVVTMPLHAQSFRAAGGGPRPITLIDDRNREQTLAAPPRRIVSLLPSLTESVCALGGCDRLVGTDRYSNSPARVLALPKLGGIEDANLERIVALKPDVVLAAPSARVIERLESLGLKVIVIESKTHADVHRSLVMLAVMLGTPAAAERVWAGIQTDVDRAVASVPTALRGQRVYFEVDATPYAAGEASFIGQTLLRLGLGNIVRAEDGPFPKLNPEFVVRAQPDIVMADQRNLDEMARRPGWSQLHALREGRVCGFSHQRYEVLVRPGPRLGEAALLLAGCLTRLVVSSR